MKGNLYVGRLAGIPFRLHWSWFLAVLLIAWALATGFFPHTLPSHSPGVYWGLSLAGALGLFGSVLLHELGHAFVARRFGIPVRGIRLFVFGGVAEMGREPRKPGHEILIALGGPAVTLFLILLFNTALGALVAGGHVAWDIGSGMFAFQGGSPLATGGAGLLYYLGMMNTVLLVFNMIPAFPLDGGRVLRGIAWAVSGNYVTSTRLAGGVGIAFAWLLFAGGFLFVVRGNLLGGAWLFFLGMFLQNAARASIAYSQLQHLLSGVRVADVMERSPVVVESHQTLQEVVDQFFLRYPHRLYPVVEEGQFVGMLTLSDVQTTNREDWDIVRAGHLAERRGSGAVIHPQRPLLDVLDSLGQHPAHSVPVVEDGWLVGLLSASDVMERLEIRGRLGLPPDRLARPSWASSGYERPSMTRLARSLRGPLSDRVRS